MISTKTTPKDYTQNTLNKFATNDDTLVSQYIKLLADEEEQLSEDRINNIEFHLKLNDYLGTLSTIIDLIRQEKQEQEERHNRILQNLKNDLLYLQKNYKLTKK